MTTSFKEFESMVHFPQQAPNDSLPYIPPNPTGGIRFGFGPGTVNLDGHYIHPLSLPKHAQCPQIQASGKCGDGCYSYYAGIGPFKCSSYFCSGHPNLWSSACYVPSRPQTSPRLAPSVLEDLEATHPSRLTAYLADRARVLRLAEDPGNDDRSPFVFRRAPRPPVVDYDNDRDNLLRMTDRHLRAELVADDPEPRPATQETSAKRATSSGYSMSIDEVEKTVQAMISDIRHKRAEKASDRQENRTQDEDTFIAQVTARFAKKERELNEQEDLYRVRDPSEDSLPSPATSMRELAERDVQIEARKRRVSAQDYRNSLVTSTRTPNTDEPSKPSLENPTIAIAIDQFLTQRPNRPESLAQKLGNLCGIALARAGKLGLEGASEDDEYLLKHMRAPTRTRPETFRNADSADDQSSASFNVKEPLSNAQGSQPMEACADAASARCQHHSCQPIRSRSRSRSRLSSTSSDTTSYGPAYQKAEASSDDAAEIEEPFRSHFPVIAEKPSLSQCIAMNGLLNGNKLGALLEPITNPVYLSK